MRRQTRCGWCDVTSWIYVHYHDDEWGVPLTDERRLFEMLILEGMQAGLSWLTILKKRQNFRRAMDNFDCQAVARYNEDDLARLLGDSGIIRNRRKLEAAVKNGGVVLELRQEYGSFSRYLWQYVDYRPIQNSFVDLSEVPAKTELSTQISKDLRKRGMNFVGPTIVYAFMQAIGMVNDHETGCFRYSQCAELAGSVREEGGYE
ncbi:MAG: DNA-3-methyladenine glycosylase I [Bacteroidetes bacterium]|jgi:DNA-3-methyladenine glycosylase I|nr:DNA-3-methyladenine glycosylase I [Bacteroidota bacterium]